MLFDYAFVCVNQYIGEVSPFSSGWFQYFHGMRIISIISRPRKDLL
jgi:hypothetical protein